MEAGPLWAALPSLKQLDIVKGEDVSHEACDTVNSEDSLGLQGSVAL